jgi:hypothetical protein
VGYTPYREIAITFEGITPDEWQDFVDELGQVVDAGDVK